MTRQPVRTPAPRIAPLATLPVFFKLKGRKVVLAGDSDAALWKAELLAATGAVLEIYCGQASDRFAHLVDSSAHVSVISRQWQPADLGGAVLAVADAATPAEAGAFVQAAKQAGAAFNVIDQPDYCAFQFGSIVNRSPLLVAISTDGAAPVFGQAIRAKIEALLPQGLQDWAQAAQVWRPAVQARGLGFALRRRFWEQFTRRALDDPRRKPVQADQDDLLAMIDREQDKAAALGRVSLVGAGPGDPELLTLKAVRVLQSADVVLYDDLVSAQVLDMARREAKRICVGKTGHLPSCPQEDICALMLELARLGQHVVRLKSGDPGIFGRATEEITACRQAGIPVAIIPGITAAQGAAAALGISLTERTHARRLQMITGHSHRGDLPDDIHWASLADPTVTSVIYMPRKTLAQLRDRAVAAGLSPDTPALAIRSATHDDQSHVLATIATLPDRMDALEATGPVLVMIGEAIRHVQEPRHAHESRHGEAAIGAQADAGRRTNFSVAAENQKTPPVAVHCHDVLYNVCFVC